MLLSTDLTDILSGLIIKSTNSVVVAFKNPPPAVLIDEPIVSFKASPKKLKLPPSELKTEDETSGSFGSWRKEKARSELELQSEVLIDIFTVGLKSIHAKLPVVPPTQLPQVSIYAIPLGVLLQSTGKSVVVRVS